MKRYLTGHLGPDSVLVLRIETLKNGPNPKIESTLFLPDPNTTEEKWEGPRIHPGMRRQCAHYTKYSEHLNAGLVGYSNV